MMMRICREEKNTNNNSSLSLPPFHDDFSQAFHRTPSLHNHPTPPPPSLPPLLPHPYSPSLGSLQSQFSPAAGNIAGDICSGEGSSFVNNMDFSLVSCTEFLGSESSDEISTVDFASSPTPMKKLWSENRSEKKEFPPPLTTMSQNGQRSFILRPQREDGRLKIVKVEIERPEYLCASRQNGRLTLHLVKIVPQFDDVEEETQQPENDVEDADEVEERECTEVDDVEETCLRRSLMALKSHEAKVLPKILLTFISTIFETGLSSSTMNREKSFIHIALQKGVNQIQQTEIKEDEEEVDEAEERESTKAMKEKGEAERGWKILATRLRRCYQYETNVLGLQRRWVTTIM